MLRPIQKENPMTNQINHRISVEVKDISQLMMRCLVRKEQGRKEKGSKEEERKGICKEKEIK